MNWLIDHVPWYVPVVIAIIALGFCWQFIAPIWALMPNWLKASVSAIGAIFVAVQYGRNKGAKDAEAKRAQDNAQAVQTRKQIDANVEAMPDSDVTKRLGDNKWLRD